MAKPVILAVDDDPQVVRAVERDLRRRYAREYRVPRADSGESALDTLGKLKLGGDPVALFLVDQRMPEKHPHHPVPQAEGYLRRGEYAEDLPKVQGRGGELNQVWTNLIDNAADAVSSSPFSPPRRSGRAQGSGSTWCAAWSSAMGVRSPCTQSRARRGSR